MSTPHITLIDASNMMQRAWAVAPKEKNDAGEEIGAARVFSRMVGKLIRRMGNGNVPPTAIAFFFDPSRDGTWRRGVSPTYKAHRSPQDPDLTSQFALIRTMCGELGMAHGLCDTHEADDMIAAYVKDAGEAGFKVSIISNDKDMLQLVRPGVMQFKPMSDEWFNAKRVEEKYAVTPDVFVDYLALVGDDGDGVKGAPGIGPKSASTLLGEFRSLDEILAHPELITRPSWRKSIEENADQIRMAKTLVSLDADGCDRPFLLRDAVLGSVRDLGQALWDWEQKISRRSGVDNDII